MERSVLHTSPREVTGKQVKALRRQGILPGILYGHNIKPTAISMNAHDAALILGRLTSSSLVTIELQGKEYPSLVREKQRDYIKGHLRHVDFQVVSLTEIIRAHVGIELAGNAPAVKDFNAVLVTGLDELEVECLPEELPERIVVDISTLLEIGDGIHVSDIVTSDKVKVLDSPEEMIVIATAPKEEEIEEVVEEVVVEEELEPELIEKGKKEEEEVEEGEEKEKEK